MCAWCWLAKHLGDYEQAASHACSASVPKLCAQLPDSSELHTFLSSVCRVRSLGLALLRPSQGLRGEGCMPGSAGAGVSSEARLGNSHLLKL